MAIPTILDFAHTLASRGVKPGGIAIDATVGNGHDTLFLVRQVGEKGTVIGFDVQKDALEAARERVRANAPSAGDSLRLVQDGHERMRKYIGADAVGAVGTVMFNLGYLPGGDHSITTAPDTTRRALAESVDILRPGGVVTVVAYPGHAGGSDEAEVVSTWSAALPDDQFLVLSYRLANQTGDPPRLYAIEKRASG